MYQVHNKGVVCGGTIGIHKRKLPCSCVRCSQSSEKSTFLLRYQVPGIRYYTRYKTQNNHDLPLERGKIQIS